MTDSDIEFIINELRKASVKWEGRRLCLERHRVSIEEGHYKNGKVKNKYYWRCAECDNIFRDESSMEVDHTIEIGPYKGNLHEYAARMFCAQSNLQALCVACHSKKTSSFNARLKYERKVKP